MSEQLFSLVPEPFEAINWNAIMLSPLGETISCLSTIQQNPVWHTEGDVLTHTQLVCEALVSDGAWHALPEQERRILFLAALLHDIGKATCTRLDGGEWSSPHHSQAGAAMARLILLQNFDLCGTPEKQAARESICMLIRAHMAPVHIMDFSMPERKVIQLSADGGQSKVFTNRLLVLLAKADTLGRISSDTKESLNAVEFFAELALEQNCLDASYPFGSSFERYMYLSGENRWPIPQYDANWGQVIMLSGLPGVGKDTYIRQNLPDLPVVSLDDIRDELGVSPIAPQAQVIVTARERAKELLRKRQAFIWNATSLTPLIRKKQISLFNAYGAATHIVYLETDWPELLRRNAARTRTVPQRVMQHMLEQLKPPLPSEAQDIVWNCV